MITKMVDELVPGDRFTYRYQDEPVPVEVVRAAEPATDRFGFPLLQFWAKRLDTGAEGLMSFGEKSTFTFTIEED